MGFLQPLHSRAFPAVLPQAAGHERAWQQTKKWSDQNGVSSEIKADPSGKGCPRNFIPLSNRPGRAGGALEQIMP